MIEMDDTAYTLSINRLMADEGFRSHVYRDTVGHETIGYGLNLDAGISEPAARAMLSVQVRDLYAQLQSYWWWAALDPVRASVVVQLAFNNGLHGLLSYVNMLSAVGKQDWNTAAAELLDSDAARALVIRYTTLANIMRTGKA